MQNNPSTALSIIPPPTIPKNSLELNIKGFELFDDGGIYISGKRLYHAYFGKIPNIKVIMFLNTEKAAKWIESVMGNDIITKHYEMRFNGHSLKKSYVSNNIFILKNDIILDFDIGSMQILFPPHYELEADRIADKLLKFRCRNGKLTNSISLITSGRMGWELVNSKIKKPKLKLELHYNDDFVPIHKTILNSIKCKDKAGLVLLYGEPGTGKSTYLRYLILSQKKKVMFLSPRLAGNLDSPDFISLLIRNKNSIIVIEDAEELLLSRESHANSAISTLLNMTDGLLGESLGIQFICTFNTQLANIDKALLRQGRLIALYEFKPLSSSKAIALLRTMRVNDYTPTAPMSLAKLFHTRDEQFNFTSINRPRIGFKK